MFSKSFPVLLTALLLACGGSPSTQKSGTDGDGGIPDGGPGGSACTSNDQCASNVCMAGTCTTPVETTCAGDHTSTTIGACDLGNTYDLDNNPTDRVNVDPDDGALVLDTTKQAHSYIWIANTNEHTISKVDTISKQELARYRTGGTSPSRTTIDLYGNAYVGHRTARSVSKFSPLGEDCPEHSGRTLTSDSNIPLPNGQDKCLLWSTVISTTGGTSRAMAVQHVTGLDGEIATYVWVGCLEDGTLHKLDGEDGTELLEINSPVDPYGFALDKNGTLWIATREPNVFGRVDTHMCTDTTCDDNILTDDDSAIMERITLSGVTSYGITVDEAQRVWLGGEDVTRYDPNAAMGSRFTTITTDFVHGIAADSAGRIWGAATHHGLLEIDADTATAVGYVPGTPGGGGNKGIGIDPQGKVWSISQQSVFATVVEPTEDGIQNNYTVDNTSVRFLNGPYTYSDMTGQQLALASQVNGYYRHTFDTCTGTNTAWENLTWSADVPTGTQLSFRARAATDASALSSAPWVTLGTTPTLTTPSDLATALSDASQDPSAAIIEIEAKLQRLESAPSEDVTPRLYTFGVTQTGCEDTVL